MNYLGYVIAAYAVFLLALLWDWLAPMLALNRARRAAAARLRRENARHRQEGSP